MNSRAEKIGGAAWRLGKRLVRDDAGQSTTEYILMLAVVLMVAVKFKSVFQAKLGTLVNTVGSDLDNATTNLESSQ